MSLNSRNIGIGVVAALIFGALIFVTLRTDPIPVDLADVMRAPMQVTINADGQTHIRDVYDVAAPISGTALRAPIEVGDPVTAGVTVVAVVERGAPALLDMRSRVQAEAAVREAQAGLAFSASQLRQAIEDLAYARQQESRTAELVARGAASQTRLEDVQALVTTRMAALDAAHSRLDMAESTLERTRAALIEPNGSGEADGEACCVEITAPIDGVVLDVSVVSKTPVLAGTTLVSIGDPENLEIIADLLSADAIRIGPGTEASVERWGGETPLVAELKSIDPVARTKISALGIEEQRVDARLDILSPPEDSPGLGHGFSVFLRLVEWREDEVLQVPLSALFRRGEVWHVFTVEDGIATGVPVDVGRRNETSAQILDGLDDGARVVMHPSDAIEDGRRVIERSAL